MAVSMIGLGASALELVMATLVLNFRHFVLSFSLMSRLPWIPKFWKAVLSFWLTDETFAVSALKADEIENQNKEIGRSEKPLSLNHAYLAGLLLVPYLFWNIGTLLGALLAMVIPPAIGDSMAIALYAMFIGLLVPALGKGWAIAGIALASALVCTSLVFLFHLNSGWAVVLATCLASIPGIFLFKEEE
jgi:predicted branched-subunit amino acid permease